MSQKTINHLDAIFSVYVYLECTTPKWRLIRRWYLKRRSNDFLKAMVYAIHERDGDGT